MQQRTNRTNQHGSAIATIRSSGMI
jgi:hypothetical protein